mgnify:CR=1 FL=1
MLALLLLFSFIPNEHQKSVFYQTSSTLEICGRSDVLYDSILAAADVLEPGWNQFPFPIWGEWARDASNNNRIFIYIDTLNPLRGTEFEYEGSIYVRQVFITIVKRREKRGY